MYIEINNLILANQLDEAILLIEMELAKTDNSNLELAQLYKLNATILIKKNDYINSQIILEKALAYIPINNNIQTIAIQSEIYFLLGFNNHVQLKYKKAYTYYYQGLQRLNEKDHADLIIQIKSHLGRLLRNFYLDGKSLQYFLEAKDIYSRISIPSHETSILYHNTLANIALHFIYAKPDHKLALEHLLEASRFFRKNHLSFNYLAVGEEIIEVYCKIGETENAEKYFVEYQEYFTKIDDPNINIDFIYLLIQFCISVYKYDFNAQTHQLNLIKAYINTHELNNNYFLGYFQILLLYYLQAIGKNVQNEVDIPYFETEIAKFLELTVNNYWLQTSSIYEKLYAFYNISNFEGANHFYRFYIDYINRTNHEKNELLTLEIKTKYQTELVEGQLKNQIEYNKKLHELNNSLNNFATIAAHDLKAPLRTISEFTKLLLRKYNAKIESSDLELFEIIISNATSLNKLIGDLLEFSNLDNNLEKESIIDLNLIIEKVLKKLKVQIDERSATIQIENLPNVIGHESLIIQLFLNVINNSLKFSKKDQPIQIIIRAKEIKEDFVTISIKDNGIGIATDFYHTIFEPFKKLNSSNDYEGNGIGLSFCKKIIDSYHGKIWVESVLGENTEILFTLKTK